MAVRRADFAGSWYPGNSSIFEDSSIGIKIGPMATLIFTISLILIVIMANAGVFDWLLTPG